MQAVNQEALLRILNPNSSTSVLPAYSHLLIENKVYALLDLDLTGLPNYSSVEPYLEYRVRVSGTLLKKKGHMPNPLMEVDVIDIDSIEFD